MNRSIAILAAVAASATALAVAPGANAAVLTVSGTCTTAAGVSFDASFDLNWAHAAILVSNASTGEFVGVLIPTNSGISGSAWSGGLTTCTFTTFQTFAVTGILAPSAP